MHFSSLSNQELHHQTLEASRAEKQSTLKLIEYLEAVNERRTYAARGYPSLWMYVHKELGYSEAQTCERVGAMRLIQKLPEVRVSLQENKLTLTSAAKLASFVRKEKVTIERAKDLLLQVEQKPSREVERILLSEQNIPEARPDSIKRVGAELTRISFDADEEMIELIDRLKQLQSDPTLSLQGLFKKTVKEYINIRERALLKTQHTASRAPKVDTRYIPMAVKREVARRSGGKCEFIASSTTGKRCESQHQLQFDHDMPYMMGGQSSAENIRHLCREHNLYEAERWYGSEKIRKFAG